MVEFQNLSLNDLLYEGPNSRVFRVINEISKECIVVKIPAAEKLSVRENLRFQHEYNLLASLALSKIIKVIDLVQYRSGFAIVEEDFGAIDLNAYVGDRHLGIKEFFELALQMAESLAQLHSANVIHKDVHLGNFLINPDTKEIKLTDFGLSSLIQTEVQEVCDPDLIEGNLEYISPEQTGRMNRTIDFRADLYSLGVCYYKLLTAQMPFHSYEAMELVHCHIAKRPKTPLEVLDKTPKVLSDIVMKLLEKRAEDRYQSAHGLLNDLGEIYSLWCEEADCDDFKLGSRDISLRFHISQKIYGRDEEIGILLKAFERSSVGASELLLVGGFSGIGKTALIGEVHKALANKSGRFISGKYDQFQRDIPFSAFIQAFRALVTQILSESEEKVAYWRTSILDVLGVNTGVIVEVIPELELITGACVRPPELDPAEAQNRFSSSFVRFISVFAKSEHPLTLFLDDLQWADAPSLQLMQLLATSSNVGYLLILGAYRDNETSPSHPLMLTLGNIKEVGISPKTIILSPLKLEDLNLLLADTLLCTTAQTLELAGLLQEKTAGNPFFISQLLKELHYMGLFWLDTSVRSWKWDTSKIISVGVADNVVELMADKIARMEPKTIQALRLAACIGNKFSLSTLSTILETNEIKAGEDIWEALHAGLVLQTDSGFRFLHDRVQQAAYSLIDKQEVELLHLKIGRLLLKSVAKERIDEAIFDILAHFNMAESKINDALERQTIAKLNLQAGYKAKSSTAYEPALRHFQTALRLLPHDSWQTEYELTMKIMCEQADVQYLLSDFEGAEASLGEALEMSRSKYDKADIHLQKITQYNRQGRYIELIDIARESLALFGVDLPYHDDADALGKRFAILMDDYNSMVAERAICDLISVQEVSDIDQDYVIRLMSILTDGSYIGVPTLFPFVVMEVVVRSMRYGHNAMSSIGFAWSTVVIIQQNNDYLGAYELGKLSMRLIERFPNPRICAQVTFLYAVCAMHWANTLHEQIQTYKTAYTQGVENGNLVFAGYARTMIPKTVLAASGVDRAIEENEISVAFYEKSGSPFLMIERFCGFFLQNLKGERADPLSLSSAEYDENEYLTLWNTPGAIFGHGLAYFLNFKLQLLYLFNEPLKAWELAQAHADWMRYIESLYETTVFAFYKALAAAVAIEYANEKTRVLMLRDLHQACDKFAVWAKNCPANFGWQEILLNAESARISGETDEAFRLYAQAGEMAALYGYNQGVALSKELAARLNLHLGEITTAESQFEDAAFYYFQWGAHAKAKTLRQNSPKKATNSDASLHNRGYFHASQTPYGAFSNTLDVNTILKATQAISEEIHLNEALRIIMKRAIENAGAERGSLILPKNDKWFVAAKVDGDTVNIGLAQDSSLGFDAMSESVVNYVIRTQKDLILQDAYSQADFVIDPNAVQTDVKSLLCLPMFFKGQLSGILYLENNLTAGAFTVERISVLKVLLAQAAISIENAKLYENLASSEQKYRSIFEKAGDLIILTDINGVIEEINPACFSILGYFQNELIGSNITKFCLDDNTASALFVDATSDENIKHYEISFVNKNGSIVETTFTSTLRPNIGRQYLVHDVTAQKQAERLRIEYNQELERQVAKRTQELSEINKKLQNLSECDGLTGIANRRKFDETLIAEHKRAARQNSSLTIAMIDVDHFKAYNDTFGHQAGDECLQKVAKALAETTKRSYDLTARYGGEEFAVILPALTQDEAYTMVEKLRNSVEALGIEHPANSASSVVTISIGAAFLAPSNLLNPQEALKIADSNLYDAKHQGRNRFVVSCTDKKPTSFI